MGYTPCAEHGGGSQRGDVGEEEDAVFDSDEDVEFDSEERQELLAALTKAKAARVMQGDEPAKKEVLAAGLSLNLHFSSLVTSYFATEEESCKFASIETSRREAREVARAWIEATQLTGKQVAPMSKASRGGLRWCYKRQMKEFIEELQESGEASRIAGKSFVEERVWSPRNPGRGTVRKRFQHYRDFITLQGTKYDTKILAALLSPGSKCAHNLLQLARKVAGKTSCDEHVSTVHKKSDLVKDGEQGYPGSKCAHNLLQLARKIASNSASNSDGPVFSGAEVAAELQSSKCAQNLLQLARKVAINSGNLPTPAKKVASNSDNLLQLARKVATSNSDSPCLPRAQNLIRSRTDDDEQASTVHQESDMEKDGEQSCFGGDDDEDTSSVCDDGCPDIRLKKSSDSSMPVLF